ncbi:DUF5694 domain-containing protein [Pontibacillus halophilus]|nr:DUF5694 domain-containing protein [Pontibacillus halophilus]
MATPEVLVLGSFHMNEQEGLQTDQRQEEIQEVVGRLLTFKPTKVAVEVEARHDERLNELYGMYRAGGYKLPNNEIDQLGFRIADRLNHSKLYAVDWMGGDEEDKNFDSVYNWVKEHQPDLFSEIFKGYELPALTEEKSILDYYKELNDPTWLRQIHSTYVNMARIGEVDNYIGMKWLTWWYRRNLILFSNLARHLSQENERILFIVGLSHSEIISNFLKESGCCKVVSPLAYLEP